METREPSPQSVLTPDVDVTAQASPPDAGAPPPDIGRTRRALRGRGGRNAAITVLAVLAVLYTLFFARDFLLPIAFALLLDFFFSPIVRAMARLGIRQPFGAAIVILALVGTIAFGIYELTGPVQKWATQAPSTLATAQEKFRVMLRPFERVTRTAEQVERATSVGTPPAPQVVVKGPSLVSRVFGTTQRLVAGALEVLVLLFFLLASGDLFLQKLIKVLPQIEDKHRAYQVARGMEASVSTYLLTQAAVNLGEAIVVTLAMWLLGMPNPALWGALVFVLEFVPYLGATAISLVLALAAITTFDSVGRALVVPAVFLAINLVQGNLVSPMLLGSRLTLNPVAIIVGLAFWWWIWGVPGAFIAVPLLATFKIVCEHVPALAPVAEFLGQRDEYERRATVRETEV